MNHSNIYRIRIFAGSDDLCLYERLSDGTTRLHGVPCMVLVSRLVAANQEIQQMREYRALTDEDQTELIAEFNKYKQALRDALKATTDTELREVVRKALGE